MYLLLSCSDLSTTQRHAYYTIWHPYIMDTVHVVHSDLHPLTHVWCAPPPCRKVTPTISVDDPLLMLGMPKGLTAATGMDALTHAIEAYVSTASTPVTDACALHAMRLVSSYLRTAVNHGDNIEARDMMRYTST